MPKITEDTILKMAMMGINKPEVETFIEAAEKLINTADEISCKSRLDFDYALNVLIRTIASFSIMDKNLKASDFDNA